MLWVGRGGVRGVRKESKSFEFRCKVKGREAGFFFFVSLRFFCLMI